MKITTMKGNYFEGDKIFLVETDGAEAITMYRLFLLVNQLAINESKRWKMFLPNLAFERFMLEAIRFGKEGVDFLDNKNDWILKQILSEVYPKEFDKKYLEYKQSRIDDFGVENEIS